MFEHLNILSPERLHIKNVRALLLLAYVFLLDEHHSEALEQDFQLLCSLQ